MRDDLLPPGGVGLLQIETTISKEGGDHQRIEMVFDNDLEFRLDLLGVGHSDNVLNAFVTGHRTGEGDLHFIQYVVVLKTVAAEPPPLRVGGNGLGRRDIGRWVMVAGPKANGERMRQTFLARVEILPKDPTMPMDLKFKVGAMEDECAWNPAILVRR